MDNPDFFPCSILLQLSQCQEDYFLRQRGYQKIRKISDTLQGDIWECQLISGDYGQKEQAQKPHIRTSNRQLKEQINIYFAKQSQSKIISISLWMKISSKNQLSLNI